MYEVWNGERLIETFGSRTEYAIREGTLYFTNDYLVIATFNKRGWTHILRTDI